MAGVLGYTEAEEKMGDGTFVFRHCISTVYPSLFPRTLLKVFCAPHRR